MSKMKWSRVGTENREQRNDVEWTTPDGKVRESPEAPDPLDGVSSQWKREQEARTSVEAGRRTGPTHLDNLTLLAKYYGGSAEGVMKRVRSSALRKKKNAAGVFKSLPSARDFPKDLTDPQLAKLVAEQLSTWDKP